MIHILAKRVLTIAPWPVEACHSTQLGQHGALVRPKLLHRVLLLGRCLLLLRDHHTWVVLVQVAWVWGTSLHLGGDVMWRGLGLHAWGWTGVWRLGLRSG